jgi:hypothetical protein
MNYFILNKCKLIDKNKKLFFNVALTNHPYFKKNKALIYDKSFALN